MKNIVIGIVAHVDAGKTTLTEAMLYHSGVTDRLGRVDKRDAYLDTHSLERARGITIFSKMAQMDVGDTHITLIDTPGHVDFSCECERALAVEDYAILVISATDGVTAHTRTLYSLLSARHIPTFIFVNKCDIADRRREDILAELRLALGDGVVDFTVGECTELYEAIAGRDVSLMNEFFETESLSDEGIRAAISKRAVLPCYFGSALKLRGVKELLAGIERYTKSTEYPSELFGARVYKIDRDRDGRRIAFTKITGGTLSPKEIIEFTNNKGERTEGKVEELRSFSAEMRRPVKHAEAGTVVAIYGIDALEAGMGLGFESNDRQTLTPVLNYSITLPDGIDPYDAFLKLSPLAEEDPALNLGYNSESKEIRVSLMGDIQREVLREIIKDRFSISVEFDEGRILYRETVCREVIGKGHFEPLTHYAEVHLRIEPLPEGSGIVAASECDTDALGISWQRLVMTHIKERTHKGVLIGAPLTDVKITLIAGRAHRNHTSGGDFRQATYRAIRQGLRKAGTVILEPTFDFRLELPSEYLGRALNDITNMRGRVDAPEINGATAALTGSCPVETMRSYSSTVRAYTRGEGKLILSPGKYQPTEDAERIAAEIGYDIERDERQTADSVFCKGGSGYTVPWYEADELMHIESREIKEDGDNGREPSARVSVARYTGSAEEDKELLRIFEATYGKIKRKSYTERRENAATDAPKEKRTKPKEKGEEYVIIDGYNVIYDWDELRPSEKIDYSLSRELLIRMISSYAAFRRCRAIIVFDAHMVKDGKGSTEKYGNLTVVYTKERQTADTYIERATYELAAKSTVRVVTSDLEEQYIILGNGALRVSAREFRRELSSAELEMQEIIEKYGKPKR